MDLLDWEVVLYIFELLFLMVIAVELSLLFSSLIDGSWTDRKDSDQSVADSINKPSGSS